MLQRLLNSTYLLFLLFSGILFTHKAFSQIELMPTAHKYIIDSLAGFDESVALASYNAEAVRTISWSDFLAGRKKLYIARKYNVGMPSVQRINRLLF